MKANVNGVIYEGTPQEIAEVMAQVERHVRVEQSGPESREAPISIEQMRDAMERAILEEEALAQEQKEISAEHERLRAAMKQNAKKSGNGKKVVHPKKVRRETVMTTNALKPWTKQETLHAIHQWNLGIPVRQIGAELGRSVNAINSRLNALSVLDRKRRGVFETETHSEVIGRYLIRDDMCEVLVLPTKKEEAKNEKQKARMVNDVISIQERKPGVPPFGAVLKGVQKDARKDLEVVPKQVHREWNMQEDETLMQLYNAGNTAKAIGTALNRTAGAVVSRVRLIQQAQKILERQALVQGLQLPPPAGA
jgi:hypothetical protein